jgi:hypothetical protein
MSTQTLKARHEGAQEAQSVSAPLPEKLFPGKAKLAGALVDYVKASLDMEEARGHLARAETDEQAALNNLELSDAGCSDLVAVAQRSRGIYSARLTNREAAQAKLLKELKASLQGAHSEYSALVGAELSRRLDILRVRVMTAGQFGAAASRDVGSLLLEHSAPIHEIRSLQFNHTAFLFSDTPEAITGIAKRILAGYETIAAKQKEQV